MKKLLFILLAITLLASGCVQKPVVQETKFVDPNNQGNYFLIRENPESRDSGTFSLITTDFVAGGSYTETSEAFTLMYGEYPVGVTLKKVEHGIEVGNGVYWFEQ